MYVSISQHSHSIRAVLQQKPRTVLITEENKCTAPAAKGPLKVLKLAPNSLGCSERKDE